MKKLYEKYRSLPVQVRASFWFLVCGFLQRGISVITVPIFTRLFTRAEYGQFSVFNSWLGILTIFVSLNLYSGVYMQGMVKFERERRQFSSALQGLTLVLTATWLGVYLLFQDFWNAIFSLTTVQMLALITMIWTAAVYGFWSSEQRLEMRYGKLVTVTLLISIIKPALGIWLVLHADDKVTARILGLVFVELVGYTGLFIGQMWRGRQFFSRRFWIYALRFNLPLVPHYLSMSVLSGADRIMISNMVGDEEAGIYSLAYSVSLLMTLFNTALLQTCEPWLYKKIKAGGLQDIAVVAYPVFILIAGINLMLIAFAPEIVAVFAPPSYRDAIWVIPPVAMSVYFMFAYSFFATFEFYYEKTGYIASASAIGAVLNVVLNVIFIKIFGYYAAGYTTLACYILYALFHYIFSRRICREFCNGEQAYNATILLAITGAFLLCGFGIMATYRFIFIRYMFIFLIIISAIIFGWRKKEILKNIMRNLQNSRELGEI